MDALTPETVDELLSAELDAEFDAAARDLGYAPAIARELLDAVPDVDARRAALAATRDAIAVPPLTDERRQELLTHATGSTGVAAVDAQRARRPLVARALGVAAIVVLLAGVGAVLATRGHNHPKSQDSASDARATAGGSASVSTSPSAVPPSEAKGSPSQEQQNAFASQIVDFGALADASALRGRVETLVGGLASADAARTEVDPELQPCVRQQAAAHGIAPDLVLAGPARYRGQPAEVFVFRRGGDYLVIAVRDPTSACRLLVSQFLHPGR